MNGNPAREKCAAATFPKRLLQNRIDFLLRRGVTLRALGSVLNKDSHERGYVIQAFHDLGAWMAKQVY
ncbi:hypothetical protein, partial [Nitrobacter sp. 62-23]